MSRRRALWPLVAYGVLGVIALARSADTPGQRRAAPEKKGVVGRPSAATRIRALERARIPLAGAPWDIPWSGWKDILRRTYDEINENRLMSVAAGVVFYCLLALFPAIAVLVALYGIFADASTIDAQVSAMSGVLPGGAVDVLHEELRRLAAIKGTNGAGFAFGLLFGLWSANSGTKAIIDALNVAYDEKERRSFIRLNLVSLLYTVVAIACMMLLIGAVVVTPIVLGTVGLGGLSGTLVAVARWPAVIAIVIVGVAAAYRYFPCRREPRWQWLTVGSLFAAVMWFVASLLFSWYITHFGAYNVTYGSLGAAVAMMMWMWISTLVILVGAQLNAEVEREAAAGRPPLQAEGAAIQRP